MRRVLLALGVMACACPGRATLTADAGVDAGPAARTLTDADAQALSERVLRDPGGRWSLTVPTEAWREVNAAARARLKPDVGSWAIDPGSTAQLTVTCRPGRASTRPELEAVLRERARVAKRQLHIASVDPVDGPWIVGWVARFETADAQLQVRHVLGLYDLASTSCEVQGWAPQATPATDGLELAVRSFTPANEQALRLGARLVRRLRDVPQLAAGAAPDGGLRPEEAVAALVAVGLPRLPPALLVERFELRLKLLSRLDERTCGDFIRQWRGGERLDWLSHLSADEAERWVGLSEAALLASQADAGVAGPTGDARRLEDRLAHEDPALADALAVVRAIDRFPAEVVCRAEKTRLRAGLALTGDDRLSLLRSWLGNAR